MFLTCFQPHSTWLVKAEMANVENATALDPAVLQPSVQHTAFLPQSHSWYQPEAQYCQQLSASLLSATAPSTSTHLPSTCEGDASVSANGDERPGKTKNALRRERRMARERQRTPINAVLPDEIVPDPPHHPDDQCQTPSVRPCSMSERGVAPPLRCYVMLKPDYMYRMCESCRLKFKLAEMRRNGVRYDGKYKATEQPTEREQQDGRLKNAKVTICSFTLKCQ